MPGIDPVRIPVTITPGTAKAVSITTDKETAAPGESVQAKMKVVDTRDNPIDQATTLKLTTIGALSIEGTDTLTVTGEVIVALKTKEPGGESYVYAKIDDPNATDLIPGYKDILVQNTLLPETGLNIMYLNLFGTDR